MSPPAVRRATSPTEALRRRTDAYARYAALVAEQLEALDILDLERLERLADGRDRIAVELERLDDPDPSVPLASDPELEQLLAAAQRELQRCDVGDRLLREQLGRLRAEAHDAIQGLDVRGAHLRSYLTAASPAAQLDVRL